MLTMVQSESAPGVRAWRNPRAGMHAEPEALELADTASVQAEGVELEAPPQPPAASTKSWRSRSGALFAAFVGASCGFVLLMLLWVGEEVYEE